VITQVPSVVPSEELATRRASTWSNDDPPQGSPESEGDSSWETLALLSSLRTSCGDFLPRPRLLG
jgi:hypothetical protein